MKTTASACGKIILFGEHAVVYNSPAIAVPLTSINAVVTVTSDNSLFIDALNYGHEINLCRVVLGKTDTLYASQETIFNTLKYFKLSKNQNARIIIDSEIPAASGLGSGASVAIATIRALTQFFGRKLTSDELYNLAFKTEEIHHGTPSGVDLSVILNEKPVFFKKPDTLELLKLPHKISLVIADTGVQSKTSVIVSEVRKSRGKYGDEFAGIRTITEQARELMLSGEILRLGPLMDDNHELLKRINVSSPELDNLVKTARDAGALGAKLSGAGRGGHMIALADGNSKEIGQSLLDAGAVRVFFAEIL